MKAVLILLFLWTALAGGAAVAQNAPLPETAAEAAAANTAGATAAVAPAKNAASGQRHDPIHVVADRLEVDNGAQAAYFSGAVKAVQGDVTIVCDKMEVYYERDAPAAADGERDRAGALMDGGGKVHTVVAAGHVKITQQDRVAVGRKATYWAGSRKILLEGQATAWRGPNQVSGEQITLFLDHNQSLVESKPGSRVTVTIFPESKPQEK
jgi:lipopolysaccharide export system protein LptA